MVAKEYRGPSPTPSPTQTLVNLHALVLKFNNFEFNGQHLFLSPMLAMGAKLAPAYASIFMGHLEKRYHGNILMVKIHS